MICVTWTWTCDICGEPYVDSSGQLQMYFHIVDLRHLPAGWSYINGQTVCPMHKIEIKEIE